MAFAIGETTDTCWNSTRSKGMSTMVIDHCTRAHMRTIPSFPVRLRATDRIAATAPKESQKPADVTASGSSVSTNISATPSIAAAGQRQPLHTDAAMTASMQIARCVGIAKPARAA